VLHPSAERSPHREDKPAAQVPKEDDAQPLTVTSANKQLTAGENDSSSVASEEVSSSHGELHSFHR